jgi:hypothetical protein
MREAELSVTDDELEAIGIGELVSLATDAGLLAFEELTCRGNGAVVQIEVERRCDEDALAGLDYVDTFTHVAERAGSHVYVVSFTAPGLPEHLEATADDLIGTCDPEVDERGATMSIVGPHEAISEQLDAYEAAGISPTLQRIGGYDGPEYPLDGLTSRQREVVETAWEMGYYEVPKDVSADQVALELGLDSSTVNEHLQRAERNLLEQIL